MTVRWYSNHATSSSHPLIEMPKVKRGLMKDSQAEEPSTGIVNHSWGACVGVVDPQGP
ncbi:hypothetical protein BofuT4_P009850.1 [Botrytis cinerea T4]|uniref:Uncharacterized protein n=1 Tax=Botryotinia fuckeliana (strain T4) TaxID=999810 RepID=G2XT23_BOTF4|nr:hypothetical protein BofuT4_P009850.1 [Botrytis cinerea T4]